MEQFVIFNESNYDCMCLLCNPNKPFTLNLYLHTCTFLCTCICAYELIQYLQFLHCTVLLIVG